MRTKVGSAIAYTLLTSATLAQQPSAALTLTPGQEAKIRAFVASEHRTSTAVSGSFRLSVGAVVPGSVVLYPFEEGLNVDQHRYAIISGKIVIVDPSSRQVVRVIE